jgi:hypothetical protein
MKTRFAIRENQIANIVVDAVRLRKAEHYAIGILARHIRMFLYLARKFFVANPKKDSHGVVRSRCQGRLFLAVLVILRGEWRTEGDKISSYQYGADGRNDQALVGTMML